jgi:hypothetical protein
LTESLTVYGFGSFFNGIAQPRDIDLDRKAQIKSALPFADIVMLSQAEAAGLDFLERAKAEKLDNLSSETMDADVQALASRLLRS